MSAMARMRGVAGSCAACQADPNESRWKGVALMVGATVFCPCHLPATLGAMAALGGTAWLAGQSWLAYLLFSALYVFVIVFGARYVMRSRDREREREAHSSEHAGAAATVASSG